MQSLSYFVLAAQLLSFAHSQAPVDPKAPASFLTFDPPLTTLDGDSTNGVFVAASLNKKPTGPVSVYIEAPNLVFSKCKLSFTAKNWNKGQVFKVSPVPYLPKAPANSEIKAKFCYSGEKDEDLHKSCQEYQVTRGKDNGSTCTTFGSNIHYKLFGELRYDFPVSGAYYMVKSDTITIQHITTPMQQLAGRPILTKLALRYYKTVYVFDAQTRKAQLVSQTGDGVDLTEAPGVRSRAALSDGSTLLVSYYGQPPIRITGVSVTLGRNYKGRISGLCGDINTKSLIMANGQPAPGPKLFSNSWKVADDDNLFTLGAKASSVIKSKTIKVVTSECKMPNFDK